MRADQRAAFEAFVLRDSRALFVTALGLTGHRQDAEDLLQVLSGGTLEPRFQLVAIQLTGTAALPRQLDVTGRNLIPVLAPPRPDPALVPAGVAQADVVHPQPDGVPVVDVQVRVNDEPFDQNADARVPSGTTPTLEVTMRVEAGERLDDLQIGLRADGTTGGTEPLDVVLLSAGGPVTGQQTFTARWDVPPGQEVRGLKIRYTNVPSIGGGRVRHEIGMGSITAV